MSLFESGHSTGRISLQEIVDGNSPRSPNPGLDVPAIVDRIVAGGWPGFLSVETHLAMRAVRGYIDEVARMDISRVDGVQRDPTKVSHLLRSLARNNATTVTAPTLVQDMTGVGGVSEETVRQYLDSLERLMFVEDQPAWNPNLRSRSRVRTLEKRHFVDPSLAAAAIRATPQRLLGDLNYTGFLFESLVVRDLRIYAQKLDATVYHYQDNTGLEVDAVVELPDGRWAAFEVKLGHAHVDEAAANLLKFRDRVDSDTGMALLVGRWRGSGGRAGRCRRRRGGVRFVGNLIAQHWIRSAEARDQFEGKLLASVCVVKFEVNRAELE